MRNSDRGEARAIARWWHNWTYDEDRPSPVTAEAAAGFAQAHAMLEVANHLGEIAGAIHGLTAEMRRGTDTSESTPLRR